MPDASCIIVLEPYVLFCGTQLFKIYVYTFSNAVKETGGVFKGFPPLFAGDAGGSILTARAGVVVGASARVTVQNS